MIPATYDPLVVTRHLNTTYLAISEGLHGSQLQLPALHDISRVMCMSVY